MTFNFSEESKLNTVKEIVCKKEFKMEDGSVSFKILKPYRFILSDNQDYPFLFLNDEQMDAHHMTHSDVEEHFYLFIPPTIIGYDE